MQGRSVAKRLGRLGLWSNMFERVGHAESNEYARRIEGLGFGAIWFPEAVGSKEVFSQSALLLGATSRVVVAPGIASIFARDAVAMANGARTLNDAFPDRFVLGLGVSHAPAVTTRGGRYERPVKTMSSYLDAMEKAPTTLPNASLPPRIVAALGPRMLSLAGAKADGAFPYFAPFQQTAIARAAIGPDSCLVMEAACVLETDPTVARTIARTYTKRYLGLANYANNLRRLGWAEEDLNGTGSDKLVDALVAWGEPRKIAAHVAALHAAGADHVCVQILTAGWPAMPVQEVDKLAAVLL